MNHREDDELFAVYKSLPEELPAPQELESKILQVLKDRGMIQKGKLRFPYLQYAAVAAACAVFFLAGIFFQKERAASHSVSMTEKTFAFFLMEDETYEAPKNETELQQRIELYRNWGRELREQGVILNGTKLQDERHVLIRNGEERSLQNPAIAGYFLIDTNDYNKALEIARTCPHLRFGGKIEVRQIHPV